MIVGRQILFASNSLAAKYRLWSQCDWSPPTTAICRDNCNATQHGDSGISEDPVVLGCMSVNSVCCSLGETVAFTWPPQDDNYIPSPSWCFWNSPINIPPKSHFHSCQWFTLLTKGTKLAYHKTPAISPSVCSDLWAQEVLAALGFEHPSSLYPPLLTPATLALLQVSWKDVFFSGFRIFRLKSSPVWPPYSHTTLPLAKFYLCFKSQLQIPQKAFLEQVTCGLPFFHCNISSPNKNEGSSTPLSLEHPQEITFTPSSVKKNPWVGPHLSSKKD